MTRSLRTRARGLAREAAEVARAVESAVDRAVAPHRSVRALLKSARVDCVLDVGAHTGGFARSLRRAGYAGRIVSFEPGSVAFDKLKKDAADDVRWQVVPVAVGETSGTATLHIAGNSVSSSLLPMQEAHTEAAPGSAPVGAEAVTTLSLHDALAAHTTSTDRVLVKLDVQGFEGRILAGAERAGPFDARVVAFVSELSLVHLYDGDETLEEVMQRLRRLGFSPVELIPGFRHPKTGALLQVDGLFARA